MKSLTPDEAKKFEEMGFTLKTTYHQTCGLCGKKLSSKDEKRLQKNLETHVNEKCNVAKWMRSATKILEIAGLKNVIMSDLWYLRDGNFIEGHERIKLEEIEILDNVKNMFDNWGKEEEVENE